MTANGWLQIAFFCPAVLLVTKPLGVYLVGVYDGRVRWLAPVERLLYRLGGVDPEEDQHWTALRRRACCSSARVSMLLTYARAAAAAPAAAQPAGLAGRARPPGVRDRGLVHDQHELAVVRRRVDDVVLLADDAARVPQLRVGGGRHGGRGRARARHRAPVGRAARATSGSTWCAARCTCCCRSRSSLALLLVQQGVIQNFEPYLEVTTLEGAKQTIAMGPVASQEAIKQLGTNGGGFFNANAAHPFENPTPWTNFWSMFAIFAIPAALTWTCSAGW